MGQKRTYTRMAPLTEEEREFAEENYYALLWYVKKVRGDWWREFEDDYYDAAVMGYLKAVKKWFERPELHRYSFLNIAVHSMRGYVGAEMKKISRRIKTVSLDAAVGGTDNAYRQEIITYESNALIYTGKRLLI